LLKVSIYHTTVQEMKTDLLKFQNYLSPQKHSNLSVIPCHGNKIGYFGLFGEKVNKVGKSNVDDVPLLYIANREKRDGQTNHITIILKKELSESNLEKYSEVIEKLKKVHHLKSDSEIMLHLMSEVIEDDWIDLGLGKVSKNGNEAYFKVIDWKSANSFRESIGLKSKDFHITVGFKDSDIHEGNYQESKFSSF
jgi:hypothetical protein